MKKQILLFSVIVLILGCKPKYADFEDYPSFSTEWTEMKYSPQGTDFMLWAPTADAVKVNIYNEGIGGEMLKSVDMEKVDNGQWIAKVDEDLSHSMSVSGKSGWVILLG